MRHRSLARALVIALLLLLLVGAPASLWAAEDDRHSVAYLGVYAKSNRNVLDASNVYAGITVSRVVENSPAAIAGLQVGDVLLSGNGQALSHPNRLADLTDGLAAGDTVALRIERDTEVMELELTATVRLVALPAALDAQGPRLRVERKRFGFEFRDADPKRLRQLGLSSRFGVEIVQMAERSPLRRAGIDSGDLLYEVDGEAIPDASLLVAFLDEFDPTRSLELTVFDSEGTRRVVEVDAHKPGMGLTSFSVPLVFSIERDEARSEYVLFKGLFRWTRLEAGSEFQLLWFIKFETGSAEELLEVGG